MAKKAKTGLFGIAAKAAPATKKAKEEKTRITVEDSTFFDDIEKLEKLNDEMKSAKAKVDMISSNIKDTCKSEWVKLYSETGKNPGSVMVENIKGEDCAQIMFIPQDKYIKVTEERAEELEELYGEDIVDETTTFSFDDKMIEKYGEILSNLIMECDEIKEADKVKIIKATTAYSVAKSTVDKLADYGDVEEVMENVRPIVSLKGAEVLKG